MNRLTIINSQDYTHESMRELPVEQIIRGFCIRNLKEKETVGWIEGDFPEIQHTLIQGDQL
jgi:hypothetical protein